MSKKMVSIWGWIFFRNHCIYNIVDDITFRNIGFLEKEVEHLTVVNGEDYLQIHITI